MSALPRQDGLFPVGLLARVDGGCIELDGPAITSGGCHLLLPTRAAAGVPRAWDVRKRDVGKSFWAAFLENYWELWGKLDTGTLSGSC